MPAQFLIAGCAALVIAGGAFAAGWRSAQNSRDSEELVATKAAQEAAQSVSGAAVTAIQGIKVKYITVQQHAETITREVPVYRDGTCQHDPRLRDAINEALTGSKPVAAGVPGESGTAR